MRGSGQSQLEDLQTLGIETCRQATDAGQVAARARDAWHEPRLDGVSGKEHDGNSLGRPLGGKRWGNTVGSKDEVHIESRQLLRQSRQPFVSAVCPPRLDDEVPTFHVAQIAELLPESLWSFLRDRRCRLTREQPDPVDLSGRLRLRAEGQREEAGEGEEHGAAREH